MAVTLGAADGGTTVVIAGGAGRSVVACADRFIVGLVARVTLSGNTFPASTKNPTRAVTSATPISSANSAITRPRGCEKAMKPNTIATGNNPSNAATSATIA
ncbi:hypothetical protein NBRGN_034_00440 [Nocardia brasiliensis NBRC 14402]|nr:hypothetical protein NBRGN_034_00440 [Nocardia brasiliensis NBRC 14402]